MITGATTYTRAQFLGRAQCERILLRPVCYCKSELNYLGDDIELRRRRRPVPDDVVRLTNGSAHEAGLINRWTALFEPRPRLGRVVKLQQDYNWDSPKWVCNSTSSGLTHSRPAQAKTHKAEHDSTTCSRSLVENVGSLVEGLHHGSSSTINMQSSSTS